MPNLADLGGLGWGSRSGGDDFTSSILLHNVISGYNRAKVVTACYRSSHTDRVVSRPQVACKTTQDNKSEGCTPGGSCNNMLLRRVLRTGQFQMQVCLVTERAMS